jgi:hypothetical protein
MGVVEATIAITVEWLCKSSVIVFTNRTKDQPLMADPFPIYQQVVKDNEAFFRDVHGYVPLSNTKTGLAGVRSRVYTKVWRDKVILPALRIYRARTEGASLDTVPEVHILSEAVLRRTCGQERGAARYHGLRTSVGSHRLRVQPGPESEPAGHAFFRIGSRCFPPSPCRNRGGWARIKRGTYKRDHTDQDATNKYNTELPRFTEVPDKP